MKLIILVLSIPSGAIRFPKGGECAFDADARGIPPSARVRQRCSEGAGSAASLASAARIPALCGLGPGVRRVLDHPAPPLALLLLPLALLALPGRSFAPCDHHHPLDPANCARSGQPIRNSAGPSTVQRRVESECDQILIIIALFNHNWSFSFQFSRNLLLNFLILSGTDQGTEYHGGAGHSQIGCLWPVDRHQLHPNPFERFHFCASDPRGGAGRRADVGRRVGGVPLRKMDTANGGAVGTRGGQHDQGTRAEPVKFRKNSVTHT